MTKHFHTQDRIQTWDLWEGTLATILPTQAIYEYRKGEMPKESLLLFRGLEQKQLK